MTVLDTEELSPLPLTPPSKEPLPLISAEELAKHATPSSAWISIKGRVYDVTHFTRVHPGGDIILTAAGGDATQVFAAFHAGTHSWRLLPALCIGALDTTTLHADPSPTESNLDIHGANTEYIRDIAEMRKELIRQRLFESNKLFYIYKILSNILLLTISIGILKNFTNWFGTFVSAILLALFWQQCGWLAHDFLHHQVFKNRLYNDLVGILVGNIFQGFSEAWWKNKHNHHHAVPNVTDNVVGGDPDILTMPLLYWSEKLIEGDNLKDLPKFLLKYQWILYWPILCMARISWLIQSVLYQFDKRNKFVTSDFLYFLEIAGLAFHHLTFFYLLSWLPSVSQKLVFAFLSQSLGGLFIGIVFTVGHNAMEIFTDSEKVTQDFVRLQLRTTRNVTPTVFSDWFTGGLNYQVEHHIWPTLPRHSLPKASRILKAFCEKHGIQYHCHGLVEGNAQVCKLLAKLSATV